MRYLPNTAVTLYTNVDCKLPNKNYSPSSPLKRLGILLFLVFNFSLMSKAASNSCEDPTEIEVNNEMSSSSINMAGQDYYFSFSTTDSVVYFDINSAGRMPIKLELYYENCDSEPIEVANLYKDSNNVQLLELKSYQIVPNGNYILKIFQNKANSVTNIDINYMSISSSYPASFGCNEVVNGSFESYLNLGNSTYRSLDRRIDYSLGWTGPALNNFSADYFHSNAPHINSRVPVNNLGNQAAKVGTSGTDAYGGLFSMFTSMNSSNSPSPYQYREWMYGTLKNTLIANHTYKVKYYVSLTTNPLYGYDCVAPGLKFVNGLNLSLGPWDINSMTADIQNFTVQQAGGGWVEISGDYLATGNESHFIIANFLPDNQSVAPSNVGNYGISYFYIDEVSVEDLDACCNGNFTLENGNVQDLKNLITSANYTTTTYSNINPSQPSETYIEINDMDLNFKGNIIFEQNIAFKNCRILMGENAKIIVEKGLIINGNQERFIKSCNENKFWDGIYIDGVSGGNFRTYKNTGGSIDYFKFENAFNGIVVENKAVNIILDVMFDRNNIALQTLPNLIPSSRISVFIERCVFDCSSPLIDNLGVNYYPQKSIIIDNATEVGTNIYDERVKMFSCEINGKAGQLFIKNSLVGLRNNLFQNFNNTGYNNGLMINETAIDIKGVVQASQPYNRVYFSENTFNLNRVSLNINDVAIVHFRGSPYNDVVNFDRSLNQPIQGFPNSKFLIASNNYHYNTSINTYNILDIKGVKIYNVEIGIQLINTIGTVISGNYIDLETQSTSSFSSKNNVYGKGIDLNNLGITTSYLDPTNTISSNTIKHSKIGILAKFAQVEITDNTIEDMNDMTAAPSSCFPYMPPCPAYPAYGIVVNNCEATIIRNKVINYVNQYSVQPKTNTNVSGIEIINSMLYTAGNTNYPDGINCNNVENTGIGIKFSASNWMSGKIYDNKMADNYYGFVLANNGSLDNVGNNGTAGHNEFAVGTFAGSATYSSYSDAAACTLYTEGGGGAFDPYIDLADKTSGGFAYTAFSKDNSGNTVQSAGCNTRTRVGNPNTTTANQNLNKSGGNSFSSLTPNLGRKPYMVHAADSALMYQNQMTFYRLAKDSALMASKQWKHFADSMKLTPMGKSTGVTSRNSVSTNASNFDANLLQINPIVERFEQGAQLSATDLDHLRLMSLECPYYDGIAVYHARYVLEALGEKTFVNPCELVERPVKSVNQNGNKSGNGNELNQREIAEQFKIYPNPTKGVVNIDFSVSDNEMVSIEIIDLMGKVQIVKGLRTSSFHTIELNELNTGIYFYRLVKNDATIHSGKLIIE